MRVYISHVIELAAVKAEEEEDGEDERWYSI